MAWLWYLLGSQTLALSPFTDKEFEAPRETSLPRITQITNWPEGEGSRGSESWTRFLQICEFWISVLHAPLGHWAHGGVLEHVQPHQADLLAPGLQLTLCLGRARY